MSNQNALRTRGLKLLAIATAMPITCLNVGVAQDQPGASTGLEEIVVTARKREESLQLVPVTIQAFSATQIEERGADSLSDLAKFAPGLTFNQGASRAASDFSIRGMTQLGPAGDNRKDLVTTFIDGVPYVGNPSTIGTEDLARVEVVKGPQSALFGRATFGGAISLITTTPGNEVKGRVSATAATYGDTRFSGSLEGPLVEDKLAGRIVVDTSSFNGFYRNSFGGRLGESEQRYGAVALSFTPTEDLSIKLRYSVRHDEDGPAATVLIARWPEHNCGPFPGFTSRPLAGLPTGMTLAESRRPFCGELRAPSGPVGVNIQLPLSTLPLIPLQEHKLDFNHRLAALSADWSVFGDYKLTAIASKQKQALKQVRDFEMAPEDRYQVYLTNEQKQDTYELRLTSPAEQRLNWMLGVAQLKTTFDTIGAFINGALFGTAGAPTPAPASLLPLRSSSKADSIFGSVGFKITDALDVSVEARRQKDIQTSGVGSATELSVETIATLPRVLARYALNSETNLFVNYAKGNQPTQGYATFFQLTPAQQVIARANGVNPNAPEAEIKNYEFGIKHREDDGRWYLNASVYYLEWVGRQGVRTVQVDLNGDGVITNLPAPAGENFNAVPFAAGDSNTRGLELDGALKVGTHWTVGGAAAYAKSNITKALNETIPLRFLGVTDAKGFEFPLVPKFSGSAYAQYDTALNDSRNLYVRTDVTYIGKRYDSIADFAWVPPQVRANLRGGVRTDKWDVSLWVNNLFDDDTLEASRYNSDSAADPFFFQLAASEAVLPHKRQIGVTATMRF
jgi:iron complex outermembrane receptor protein